MNLNWAMQRNIVHYTNREGKAGFVKGWIETGSLPESASLGVACGTANALVQGAGKCHREDIAAFFEEIQPIKL